MSEPEAGKWISDQDQAAVNLGAAVRAGDVAAVQGMLRDDPALATARLGTRERPAADRGRRGPECADDQQGDVAGPARRCPWQRPVG